MRTITAAFVVTSLLATSALAAPASVAPLPAGKPAGVTEAALLGPNFAIVMVGLGIVIGGTILAVSNNSGDGVTTPTTTSTRTAGLP
jgi:hypothetical protein